MKHGHRFKDLRGKPFTWLTAKNISGKNKSGHMLWNCTRKCGNTVIVSGANLASGNTNSCGCFKVLAVKRSRTIHGHKQRGKSTPEYNSYTSAKTRCNNPNCDKYQYYGGRGIKFLFTSFEQFFAELGPRPKGKTLDRIQNNGNYEIDNVRWSTQEEQINNRRALQPRRKPSASTTLPARQAA